jgi:hypothetical protein
MKSHLKDRFPTVSLLGPAVFLLSGGAAGLWLVLAQDGEQVLPAVLVLAMTAVLGAVWLVRVRAARRLLATLDAYAEREIARERFERVFKSVASGQAPWAGTVGH